MNPISVVLTEQNGQATTKQLSAPTTLIRDSFGVKSVKECLRFSNGYMTARAGDLYFREVRVTFPMPVTIVPRKNVKQISPTVVVIGNTPGGDVWLTQRTFRLRYSYVGDPLTKPMLRTNTQIGPVLIPFPNALRGQYTRGGTWRVVLLSGVHSSSDGGEMWTDALGPWQPLGDPQTGPGGFNGIDVCPGWEQDSATTLLRSDLHAERMLDCLDQITGEPVAHPTISSRGYTLEKGDFTNGTLPAFWNAVDTSPGGSNAAVPKKLNTGTCAYEAALHAYKPHNGQHLCRQFLPALGAWRVYGDECAAFDLQMIAADARYAHPRPSEAVQGQGSTFYGRREPGWVSMLWSELAQRNGMASQIAKCQTAAGTFMRVPALPDPYFNPRPWLGGPTNILSHRLPTTEHVSQSQEELAATDTALVSADMARNAIINCERQFLDPTSITRTIGHVPRFYATGNAAGPYPKILDGAYSPDGSDADYAPILAFGLMCWADPSRRSQWLDAACLVLNGYAPTGFRPLKRSNLYAAFKDDYGTRGQSAALLAALEAQ